MNFSSSQLDNGTSGSGTIVFVEIPNLHKHPNPKKLKGASVHSWRLIKTIEAVGPGVMFSPTTVCHIRPSGCWHSLHWHTSKHLTAHRRSLNERGHSYGNRMKHWGWNAKAHRQKRGFLQSWPCHNMSFYELCKCFPNAKLFDYPIPCAFPKSCFSQSRSTWSLLQSTAKPMLSSFKAESLGPTKCRNTG